MKILIMADGGKGVGLGHIIRTLALAKVLRTQHNVKYICSSRDAFKAGREVVIKENIDIITIECESEVLKIEGDFIIVDKYCISQEFIEKLSKKFTVMYIDDNNLLEYYPVDIILNHNVYGEKINYKTNASILAGNKYTLIREEFNKYDPIEIKKNITNVLITVGGSDDYNLTEKILNILPEDRIIKHVVIASSFKFKERLLKIKRKNVKMYYDPNMASLMKEMDMAISACGSTLNELSYLGIPTIGVIVADNQINLAKYMEKNNCIVLSDISNLDNYISVMSYELRIKLSDNMKKLIDGKGILRIKAEIEKFDNINKK